MKLLKRLYLLAILISLSFLLADCTDKDKEISEFRTYSNIYYTVPFPSDWLEPEIINNKVLFTDKDRRLTLDIQAILYEDSVEDLIDNIAYETCMIDGTKGYVIKSEEKDEIRTIYLIRKNNTLFQLKFVYPLHNESGQAFINQIEKTFAFHNFQSESFENWNKYSAGNLEVYYPDDSKIYDTIREWTDDRVEAFRAATEYLDVKWEYEPIKMFVFDSQEHGAQYGLQLGFALPDLNQIYTLYNQTKGHEIAHCISHKVNNGMTIDSYLIEEGLAAYLDMSGRDYHRLAKERLQENDQSLHLLGDSFWDNEDAYLFGASFVKYLIDAYGLELFKEFYSQNAYDEEASFQKFYGKNGSTLINEWVEFLKTY